MPEHVVFTATFFMDETLRFIAGASLLPGVGQALSEIVRLIRVELA